MAASVRGTCSCEFTNNLNRYIYPSTIRQKMAVLFRDKSCEHWWLPDESAFSPILRSIRSFAEERNAAAVTAQQESLREIRHIFAKLEL